MMSIPGEPQEADFLFENLTYIMFRLGEEGLYFWLQAYYIEYLLDKEQISN